MSYILDALRRADSERERGAVPTINAQPLPVDSGDDERPRTRLSLWAAGAVGLLLLGALAARVLMHEQREERAPVPPPVANQAKAQVLPGSAALTPQVSVTTGAPVPLVPTRVPAPATSAPAVPPPAVAPAVAAAPAPTPTPIAAPAVVPTTLAVSAPAAPASAAVDRPVPTLKELPDAIRRELPALATGGSMYSDTPAARMIILNGQVFHEGDTVAPNLVLEQIRPRGAVLSFKGYRYSIGY